MGHTSQGDAAWEQVPGFDGDYLRYWDAFYERFQFKPGVNSRPAIREPAPSVTFDLSTVFANGPTDGGAAQRRVDRLNNEVLEAFRAGFPGARIVVLNWHHLTYWLFPDRFHPDNEEEWRVPVFPNGDYYIFLTDDMANGTFGHPWEQTLCVFGQALLDNVEPALTAWLPVSRRDGRNLTTDV